ncbi:MAG: zf-HC2 domain-containing protein, partial [Acidobacteriota bacterium]
MTDHDRYGELAGPYALGILSADDRRLFEAHLAGCPECRTEVRDAAIVAEALGHAVAAEEPPAALRDRVLAAAFSAAPAAARPARVVPIASAPRAAGRV